MSHFLEPGTMLAERYEILDRIGVGGFGAVYKAKQVTTGQLVAVKVLLDDQHRDVAAREDHKRRFLREMQLVAALNHPNIVQLKDSGLHEGERFMVLDFIEGKELSDLLTEQGPLEPGLARRVISQVLEALSAAHAKGIVHRDLKPQNIMLTGPERRPVAVVLDFGIANVVQEHRGEDWQTITRAGVLHGTPAYMSPEQIKQKNVTPRSDLYAMGLILLQCLTGEIPVGGDSLMEICFKQVQEPTPISENIANSPLGLVIRRAVEKRPEDRYQSAEEMLDALERLEHMDLTAISPVVDPTPYAATHSKELAQLASTLGTEDFALPKRSALAWVAGLGGVAAAAAVGWFVLTGSTATRGTAEAEHVAAPEVIADVAEAPATTPGAPAPVAQIPKGLAPALTRASSASVAGLPHTPAPSLVTWHIESRPSAVVRLGDDELCAQTPCDVERSAPDAPLEVTLRADGYRDRVITLAPSGGTVSTRLRAERTTSVGSQHTVSTQTQGNGGGNAVDRPPAFD